MAAIRFDGVLPTVVLAANLLLATVCVFLCPSLSVNSNNCGRHMMITTALALDMSPVTTVPQDIANYHKMLYDLKNLRTKFFKLYNGTGNLTSLKFSFAEVQMLRHQHRILTLRSVIWYKTNVHRIPSRHIPHIVPTKPRSLLFIREQLRYTLYTDGLLSVRQRVRLNDKLNEVLVAVFRRRHALYHQIGKFKPTPHTNDSKHNYKVQSIRNQIRELQDSPFSLPIVAYGT